jgi:hypothetical protein
MKESSRNGKIARLPKPLREELNRRLQKGDSGRSLVAWLNRQRVVQELIKTKFEGHPIREQNLSQWKNGGYRDWLQHQEALELAERLYEGADDLTSNEQRLPLSKVLEIWLSARYAVATREIADTEGEPGWRLLRQMCHDVVKLRRLDQIRERMELERERIELHRQRLELEREQFEYSSQPEPEPWWQDMPREDRIAWARRPENLGRVQTRTTAEERANWEKIREFLKHREDDRSRDWSEEERIAWARLPENYRGVYAAGLTPEEKERYRRRILGCETEEDKAYFAKIEAQREQLAKENEAEEKESGVEEVDEDEEDGEGENEAGEGGEEEPGDDGRAGASSEETSS